MNKKRILGFVLLAIGVLLILNSQVNILGAVIGISAITSAISLILGLVFLISGILLFEALREKESALELKLGIRSKKELAHLSDKQRSFRKKLINLFDKQKPIDNKKIAYLLPQYEKVRDTGEYIGGHGYKVYQGRKGDIEEYFSIDTREEADVELYGKKFPRLLPTHIDIQERLDKNKYKKIGKEEIDWEKMIKESESADIFRYFRRIRKKQKKD